MQDLKVFEKNPVVKRAIGALFSERYIKMEQSMVCQGGDVARKLNDQQQAFVLHYTSAPGAIGNGAEAARRAGYSEKSAAELARQLLEKPHIRSAIFDANRAAISGRLTTKSVALLERVIDDESASLKVRVEAAKTVLDRAGFVAAIVNVERQDTKSLSEMTRAELEAVVAQGAAVLKSAGALQTGPVN